MKNLFNFVFAAFTVAMLATACGGAKTEEAATEAAPATEETTTEAAPVTEEAAAPVADTTAAAATPEAAH